MIEVNEKNNIIKINRGDSAYITLHIKDADGKDYPLTDEDKIQIYVRTRPSTGDLLFKGDIYKDENGNVIWHIRTTDTQTLPITTCYYDAQLVTGEDCYTFIEPTKFIVKDEVTYDY